MNAKRESVSDRIKIRLATETEAVFLRLDSEQRVYEIQHQAYDVSGRVVEDQIHVMPAHQLRRL